MFGADGSTLQAKEFLRKKNVLVERGRFRPITHVNLDMLNQATEAFKQKEGVDPDKIMPVMEITMNDLAQEGEVLDLEDFIARADIIASTGHAVLITDFFRFHTLGRFLRRCTSEKIGIVMGFPTVEPLFEERFYDRDEGGILEAFGHLFKRGTHVFVYPFKDPITGKVSTVNDVELPEKLQYLFKYLLARDCIVPIEPSDDSLLGIFSPQVLGKISEGDDSWEELVPAEVAEVIKQRKLFGYE